MPLVRAALGTARPERLAGVRRGTSARTYPLLNGSRKYPCGILPPDLVFDNQRQRVGCARLLTLKGVMSVAVERGRFLLTAERMRNPILYLFKYSCKPLFACGEDFPRG